MSRFLWFTVYMVTRNNQGIQVD